MRRTQYLEPENTTKPPLLSPDGEETAKFTGLELTSSTKTPPMMMILPLAYAHEPTYLPYVNTHTKLQCLDFLINQLAPLLLNQPSCPSSMTLSKKYMHKMPASSVMDL